MKAGEKGGTMTQKELRQGGHKEGIRREGGGGGKKRKGRDEDLEGDRG